MRYSPARWFWIAFLGMTLGMAYDYLHVWGRVLYYAEPHFAGTSLWVFPEFGVISVLAVIGINALSRRFPFPQVTLRRTIADALLLALAHLAAAHFAGEGRADNATAFWVIGAMAALCVFSRPGKLVLLCSAIIAIVAPIGETIVSNAGFFSYFHGEPVVPRWLSFTWIIGVGLMIDATALFNGGGRKAAWNSP